MRIDDNRSVLDLEDLQDLLAGARRIYFEQYARGARDEGLLEDAHQALEKA